MIKITYGGYLEGDDIIKVCNKMNIYNITPNNIFRSNELGGASSVMVFYNNHILYIYREENSHNIFSVHNAYFHSYDLNEKVKKHNNFNNLSDQDKHHLFHDDNNQMSIYENKNHPNILLAIDAWNAYLCISYGKKYSIDNINLSDNRKNYSIDD